MSRVDRQSPTVWRLSAGELALVLVGLAVFGFGIGIGLEWTGVGWALLPIATVLIAFGFALAMARTKGPSTNRPSVTMDSAEAVPKLQIGSMPRPRAIYYYLSAIGGAALALTLGGLIMLALPGDVTALVLLILGVVVWTGVVLTSLRFQLRR